MPPSTSGLTPVCWITRVCTVVEVTTRTPVSGRNASPVVSGDRPSCCLQEVGEKQKDGKDARAGQGDRGVRAAAGTVPDDVQRQQRMLGSALDQHERRQQHGAGDQRHDRGRRAPGVRLGVGEPVDQREQTQRRGENPGYVDRFPLRRTVIDQQAQRHDRRRHSDHEVDVQAPAPRQDLRERAAEYQSERGAAAGDRTEDPERRRPVGRPLRTSPSATPAPTARAVRRMPPGAFGRPRARRRTAPARRSPRRPRTRPGRRSASTCGRTDHRACRPAAAGCRTPARTR